MALLERLQILIDADAKGAVREFDKAGAAADKLDAKLEKGSAKTSARLTSIGTKAAIGGTVVLGGLFKLAQASDEAEQQQLKLENSIKNSDQAFSNGGKSLTDLATSLQKVTAADGDAIVGAESLLVQMGLTEDQVKQITPLVVDLSRKLGIDLDAAAKMVGKSIGGTAGDLKKAGIDIDATKLKADGFGTTMEALAGSVGGFARKEGATFSGQLQILKNSLGDLGESVGKGAAGVFSDLAGGANGALGALNDLNPAIGDSVGRVGAVGGIAVTAVGGLAVLAGQFTKVKDAAFNAEGGLTRFGKASVGIGVAAGALAVYEIVQAINDAQIASVTFKKAVGDLADAKGPAELGKAFKQAEQDSKSLADKAGELSNVFGSASPFDAERVSVEGYDVSLSDVKRTLGSLAKDGNITALSNAIAVLENNTKGSKQEIKDLQAILKPFKEDVKNSAGATAAATIAQREQAKAVEEAVDAYDKENFTLEGVQKSIKDYTEKVKVLTSAYDMAQTGAKAFGDQIERSTTLDDQASAANKAGTEYGKLQGVIAKLPKDLDIAQLAFGGLSEEQREATESFLSTGGAIQSFLQSLIEGGASPEFVSATAAKYRDEITKALAAQGKDPQEYLEAIGLTDVQVQVALNFQKAQQALVGFQSYLAVFGTELENNPAYQAKIKPYLDKQDWVGAYFVTAEAVQNAANSNPIKVGVQILPGEPGFVGPIAPGSPGYGTAPQTQPRPKSAKKSGRRRALGGPLAKGQRSMVNEMGPEMFVPTSSGFVMDSDDSKALVRGVEAMLAGGGGHTFNITTSDPQLVATEVVRKQRDAAYLIGR